MGQHGHHDTWTTRARVEEAPSLPWSWLTWTSSCQLYDLATSLPSLHLLSLHLHSVVRMRSLARRLDDWIGCQQSLMSVRRRVGHRDGRSYSHWFVTMATT